MGSPNATWKRLPFWTKLSMSAFASSPALLLIASFLDNYRKWKKMGPGGLPYSVKGYLLNLYVTWTMAYSDTKTLEFCERPGLFASQWPHASETERQASQQTFMKASLSQRLGPQTRALPFVIPQRQNNADVMVDADIRKQYLAAFDELQRTNSTSTECKTSVLEKRGKALFLKPDLPIRQLDASSQREIAHIYNSDLSGHVTLSFADAKDVIAKGYRERHRLSGTKMIPAGYTMVYVPRSLDEVDIVVNIRQAGIEYMRSG